MTEMVYDYGKPGILDEGEIRGYKYIAASYGSHPCASYTKRSDAELAESGLNFLEALREEGLGDIIVEKVDPRTLQSTIKDYVEEHGELSEGLDSVIRSYEYNDITRRKESAGRKKK